MMTIIDNLKYQQHRVKRDELHNSMIHELWLPILLFGSMGAITWAIRGSSGWGGVDGTVLPGLTWGILWYYLCQRKGVDARSIVFWLGMGIALGGELGYGQYVSWIRGIFNVGDDTIPISPWIGYGWFVLCGIGWAAPGGILLGWALGQRASKGFWITRSLLLLILLVLLFAWPFVDWLAGQFVRYCPGLLFPNADMGLYVSELDQHLGRTVYTNTQNFSVVIWWVTSLLVAFLQRDKTTLVTGILIGGGFGLGFTQSALWCLGYGIAPTYIDWWKMWELNAGFNLGLLYAVALSWAIRQTDKTHHPNGVRRVKVDEDIVHARKNERQKTLYMSIGGSALVFFMGFEYFFWTGILLSAFFLISVCLTVKGIGKTNEIKRIPEQRKNILLTYSIFLLVFLMFHGGSSRAGILLGLYKSTAVEQYAWPTARIALFLPVALIIVFVTLFKMWRILSPTQKSTDQGLVNSSLSIRMVDLITGMGFIGAVSIWPAKIGVLYALFIFLALFAFNRINRWLNGIDSANIYTQNQDRDST